MKNFKGKASAFWGRYKEDYLFILPFMLVFFTFTVLPVVISIFLSFTRFDIVQSPAFIGMRNYFRLFMDDSLFPVALKTRCFWLL